MSYESLVCSPTTSSPNKRRRFSNLFRTGLRMLFDRDLAGIDFEQVVVCQDQACGLKALIAIHSTARGPAFGGIRRRVFASEHDGMGRSVGASSGHVLQVRAGTTPRRGSEMRNL